MITKGSSSLATTKISKYKILPSLNGNKIGVNEH